jgi:hypothetical protein
MRLKEAKFGGQRSEISVIIAQRSNAGKSTGRKRSFVPHCGTRPDGGTIIPALKRWAIVRESKATIVPALKRWDIVRESETTSWSKASGAKAVGCYQETETEETPNVQYRIGEAL